MAYDFPDGSWFTATSAVVPTYPFTVSFWFKLNQTLSTVDYMGGTYTAGSSNDNRLTMGYYPAAGNKLIAQTSGVGTSAFAASGNAVTIGKWHHACGRFNNASSREAILDGDTAQTGLNSLTRVATWDAYVLGARANTDSWDADCVIQEFAIYDVRLRDDEIEALGQQAVSPLLVRPNDLLFYTPLLPDLSGSPNNVIRVQERIQQTDVSISFLQIPKPEPVAHYPTIYPPPAMISAPPAVGHAGPLVNSLRLKSKLQGLVA